MQSETQNFFKPDTNDFQTIQKKGKKILHLKKKGFPKGIEKCNIGGRKIDFESKKFLSQNLLQYRKRDLK
jgi:hypothetical protein